MESPEIRMKYQKCTMRRHCRDCIAEAQEGKRAGVGVHPTEVMERGRKRNSSGEWDLLGWVWLFMCKNRRCYTV